MRLIELDQFDAGGYSIVADVFVEKGQWKNAIPMLEKEYKYSSPNLQWHVLGTLARAYEKTGDLNKAVEMFNLGATSASDAIIKATMTEDAKRLRELMK